MNTLTPIQAIAFLRSAALSGEKLNDYDNERIDGAIKMIGMNDVKTWLGRMKDKGTTVLLTWRADTNVWECSWTTSGGRYAGSHSDILESIKECVRKFQDETGVHFGEDFTAAALSATEQLSAERGEGEGK
jgi:hypothetical protein